MRQQHTQGSSPYSGESYWSGHYHSRNHTSKSDWAGISLADAFRMNLPYYVRTPALRMFYRQVQKVQLRLARITGKGTEEDYSPLTKPQLSPCYTTYPLSLAVPAAIGQTAFLEYQALVESQTLRTRLKQYLDNPGAYDNVGVDPKVYSRVADVVTDYVETRLLLEELGRDEGLSSIEIYRLFGASQLRLNFVSLPDILRAVILYGDLLPDHRDLRLHPLTRLLLDKLYHLSQPIVSHLAQAKGATLLDLGAQWVKRICRRLAPYLPPPNAPENKADENEGLDLELDLGDGQGPGSLQLPSEKPSSLTNEKVGPLLGPNPPSMFDAANPQQDLAQLMSGAAGRSKHKAGALDEFMQAVEAAGGQTNNWEDMRSDLLERQLGIRPFEQGPLQGHPASGHEVNVDLGDKENQGGEVFDRPLGLSDDLVAHDQLMQEAQPIIEALKRNLYPNLRQVPRVKRLKTSGTLDPGRLAMAEISSTVFRRYRIYQQAERKGRPVVVIAADGSGSLNQYQMRMLKNLAAGWLVSTMGSEIQLLAGLYHSGQIREGTSGPLVQWMYHPQKTPAFGRGEATRAIVSLPSQGTGVQSDALSLAFILEQAEALARRNMVYLVLLTDCAWNRSFVGKRSGTQEVQDFFIHTQKRLKDRLHTTLVGLGVNGNTGMESIIEDIIAVSGDELKSPTQVSEKIGTHVAGILNRHSGDQQKQQ